MRELAEAQRLRLALIVRDLFRYEDWLGFWTLQLRRMENQHTLARAADAGGQPTRREHSEEGLR